MRYVMIVNNKAHWIFEQDTVPNFPPDSGGNPIVVIDITGRNDVQEGCDYDTVTGDFFELTEPGYSPEPAKLAEQLVEPNNKGDATWKTKSWKKLFLKLWTK